MHNKNNFALVRKSSSAVEKATPRTKRILSGMVVDMLALTKKKTVKIIIVDDEEWLSEMIKVCILDVFANVTLQIYRDTTEAWQELIRADPDLFITDDIMGKQNGMDFVERLKARNVTYPIIMHFHDISASWVQTYADKISNVSFLRRPFTTEQLCKELLKHLESRLQFHNSKP